MISGPRPRVMTAPAAAFETESQPQSPAAVEAVRPGAVILASHDRWLRRRWTGPEFALTGAASAA